MSRFSRGTSTTIVLLAAGVLSACVPMQRHQRAYADLCQAEYQFKVQGPKGEETLFLRTYLYDHDVPLNVSRYEQALFSIPYVNGPQAKPEFYVQLIAWNKDRIRPSKPGSRGEPPIPIIFDSRNAYVTLDDGSKVYARPELFLGMLAYDFPISDMNFARPSPYDINSDEVHRRVPKVTNNSDYGSAYVVFKAYNFNANSKWTVHLGELDVNGQKVPLPAMPLCHQPEKTWTGIEPLMRP